MPIDASIPLSGKTSVQLLNPMDVAQQAMTMRKMAVQDQTLEREQAQATAVRDLYKKNVVTGADGKKSLNQEGVLSGLLDLSPEKHAEMQATFRNQDLEKLKYHTNAQASLAQSIVDEPSYYQARTQALKMGLPGSENLPEQYPGEAFVEKMKLATLNSKEQIENHINQQKTEFDQADKKTGRQIDMAKLSIDQQKMLAEKKKADGEAGGFTVGQKALDRDYAKDFNDWTSTGKAALDKNLQRLEDAKKALQEDDSLTGPIRGSAPDMFRNWSNEKAITTRDMVRAAAQGALKATLGSAFTEKEGERIMNQAYNEKLSPQANIDKIDAAILELTTARNNADNKAQYFQEHKGTLQGHGLPKSSAPNAKSINANFHPETGEAFKWAKANPNDPKAKLIMERIGN